MGSTQDMLHFWVLQPIAVAATPSQIHASSAGNTPKT
jgi:hypothetical protein